MLIFAIVAPICLIVGIIVAKVSAEKTVDRLYDFDDYNRKEILVSRKDYEEWRKENENCNTVFKTFRRRKNK